MTDLFDPVSVGALRLPNRIVMAPMTRNRAGTGNVPTPLMATYYRQRAVHRPGGHRPGGRRPRRLRGAVPRQSHLVERFRIGAPLNQPDRATFYGGHARGYTDYPVYRIDLTTYGATRP